MLQDTYIAIEERLRTDESGKLVAPNFEIFKQNLNNLHQAPGHWKLNKVNPDHIGVKYFFFIWGGGGQVEPCLCFALLYLLVKKIRNVLDL